MNELDIIIDFGREMKTVSSRRGALINLEKKSAYLTNERHTIALIITNDFGTGRFYSGEAPKGIKEVRLREEKTLFITESKGSVRRILIPTKKNIKDELDESFKEYWNEPKVLIPPKAFSAIDPAILMTSLSFYQNKMIVTQLRADGTVEIESLIDLDHGFIVQDVEDSNTITIYTSDFLLLKYLHNPKISIIDNIKPLVLEGKIKGMPVRGLIAYHKYEV